MPVYRFALSSAEVLKQAKHEQRLAYHALDRLVRSIAKRQEEIDAFVRKSKKTKDAHG